jgi:hypothetical protein
MEKCPYCERKFEWIKDFPVIYINQFQKLEVPETLKISRGYPLPDKVYKNLFLDLVRRVVDNPKIPKEVLRELRKSRAPEVKVKHGNSIYSIEHSLKGYFFDCVPREHPKSAIPISVMDIISNKAIELLKSPDVQKTLSQLEAMVGKEVRTKEIFSLQGFDEKRIKYAGLNDIQFMFRGEEILENGLRKLKLGLAAEVDEYDCHLGGSPIGIYQNLAEIIYEGRINPERDKYLHR